MNTRKNDPAVAPEDRVLVITRIFDAPPSLVFKAWTEKKHIGQWLAPRAFTIPHSEGEVRPGGHWRSCMRKPDGTELWLGGAYREVIESQRLVFTHAWDEPDGTRGHETVVTVTFEDYDGKTRLTLYQTIFKSVESRDGHRGGWNECLDRLAEYLPELLSQEAMI
ncbi:MAG: SRPBCC domain-containing protein [Gammaproteobacteria bacterium]